MVRQRFRRDLVSVRASNSQTILSAGVHANRSMASYGSGGTVRGKDGVRKIEQKVG